MKENIKIGDFSFIPYINEEKIIEVVKSIANKINIEYKDKNPIFLVILNGAFRFASDLSRHMDINCEWQFIKISSYQGTSSTGEVVISDNRSLELEGRHLILVEDIIDTGTTMHYFFKKLDEKSPASISLTSILVKYDAITHPVEINYPGISIPDKFVVGYGLDYNEQGRNLNDIWQIDEEKAL